MRTIITKILCVSVFAVGISLPHTFAQTAQGDIQAKIAATVVADVGIYGGDFVSKDSHGATIGFTLKSNLGTQGGVRYGVRAYRNVSGKRTLLDTYVANDTLTLAPQKYTYEEITYNPPADVSGEVELSIIAKTESDLPLSEIVIGKTTFAKASNVPTLTVQSCDMKNLNAGISCMIKNTGTKSASALFYSELRTNSQFGTLIASPFSELLNLKAGESKIVTLANIPNNIGAGTYALETRLMVRDPEMLIERNVYTGIVEGMVAKIENIFVTQKSRNTYSVGVISLTHEKNVFVKVSMQNNDTVCGGKSGAFIRPRADLEITTNRCMPNQIIVELSGDNNVALDRKVIAYTPELGGQMSTTQAIKTLGYGFGGVLGLLIVYFILRRKNMVE